MSPPPFAPMMMMPSPYQFFAQTSASRSLNAQLKAILSSSGDADSHSGVVSQTDLLSLAEGTP